MVPLRASTTKSESLPDDPTAFAPSTLWKLPCITTWADSQSQNHPTNSAEEAEVLALLKTGHASGAYGRWRTLHETAVTAWFISCGDQLLAEKYLAHQDIKSLEDAEDFQNKCADLGLGPISDEH